MRLINQLAKCEAVDGTAGVERFPTAAALRPRLTECVARYALEPDVADFSRSLVISQPELLCASTDLLRLPERTVWVEWTEEALGNAPAFKVGLLVESDESGRRGDITVVLEGACGDPTVSPASFAFDFDAGYPCINADVRFSMKHDEVALASFLEHIQGWIDPSWARLWMSQGGAKTLAQQKRHLAQSLWMAPCLLFAFCLILETNAQIEKHQIGYARLNQRRAKRGRKPLFEHSEVHLRLFQTEVASHSGISQTEGARRAARLHHVRGHFVRRANAIFWRRPHLRGDNEGTQANYFTRRVTLGR